MVGEIEGVLDALNRAQVRYLVAGGVAVVLHEYLRTTADLIVQLERKNVLRAMRALGDLQYHPRAPVPFSLWSPAHPTLEIDLFVTEPFDFEAVYSRALRVPLKTTEITVIGHEDLIALKRQVGRPRDEEDIAALESLRDAQRQREEGQDA